MLLGCLVQGQTPHSVRNRVNAFLPINRREKDFSILTVSEEQIHLHLPSPTQITGLPQDSNPSNNRLLLEQPGKGARRRQALEWTGR